MPKPMGRPKKPDSEAKRYPLGMRTTLEMQRKMQDAARASGRSVAQEVEFRLERSFRDDELRAIIREELARAQFQPG